MSKPLRLYKLINMLSIDVVLGALFSALFFAKLFKVTILPYGMATLALTVWIIYTADHLHDARGLKNTKASSERHRFHQRNFKPLLFAMVSAILLDCILLFFIRKPVFLWGIGLTCFVCVYLIFQRRFFFLKEFVVALLYTGGILLPSISVTKVHMTLVNLGFVTQFFLLALLNLLIFSWFDADNDSRDNLASFVTKFGRKFSKKFISGVFVVTIIIQAQLIFASSDLISSMVFFIMTATLLLIFSFPTFFSKNEYYRIFGDCIFMFPIITVL